MPPTSKTIWLARRAAAQRLRAGLLRDARELLQGARRHVRLEGAVEGGVEHRLLHRQAVGVGRDHPQLLPRRRDEDAGEDRPRLVARGRPGDLADRLDERLRRHGDDGVAAGVGERREVLAAQRPDVEGGGARHDLDVLLRGAQLDRHGVGRQRPRHVEGQAGGEDGGAGALDLGLEGNAEPDLHVGRAQLDLAVLGHDLDAGERLDGAAGGGDARDGLQLSEQLVCRSLQLHDGYLREMEGVIGAVDVCTAAGKAGDAGSGAHMEVLCAVCQSSWSARRLAMTVWAAS